ncbi:hypothetical protein C0989_011133, partial [Termitomyces sp. Mn162]
MAPGVVCPVPMGSRVMQADMTPEYFAEAAGRARGPPTLEWCQVVALCVFCTRRGEQCEFEEPVPGVWWDTSQNRGGITSGWSKRRASPLPEVGPSKWAWGEPALAGPPGPMVYSLTSGTLVEPSAGGLWLIVEAFLQRWAEELERLLAACGEEVRR